MLSSLAARLSRTAPDVLRLSLARARHAPSSILSPTTWSLLHACRALSTTTARTAAQTTTADQKPAKPKRAAAAGTKPKAKPKAKPKTKTNKAPAKTRKAAAPTTTKAKAKPKAKPKAKATRKAKTKAKTKAVPRRGNAFSCFVHEPT
jgi:outer membrane biosynthesis protein TonB